MRRAEILLEEIFSVSAFDLMRALQHSFKQKPEFLHCSLWWSKIVLKSGISKRAVYRLSGSWLREDLEDCSSRNWGLGILGVCGVGVQGAPACGATWTAAVWRALAGLPPQY